MCWLGEYYGDYAGFSCSFLSMCVFSHMDGIYIQVVGRYK